MESQLDVLLVPRDRIGSYDDALVLHNVLQEQGIGSVIEQGVLTVFLEAETTEEQVRTLLTNAALARTRRHLMQGTSTRPESLLN
ncbi:hypothetical protein COU76_02295 [Candidatus Peregrinibacteria bacterium CG10_big_fil_rev_8_21_14_0_10_49_10]|nr:MAG: hypothetical protein COU76_02295 [Candidatus Peregrinibacteria bacterium CG10_big_fil_rev_8_21_14_0_10_49_10]